MSIAALLPLGAEINPGQNRLSSVQLVNWGTFNGAHTIHVDRAGTLLTGDSGVGKSTIFDGILQIMDARPRMNEAAHADAGRGREDRRTTFSYMRGRLGTTSNGSLPSTSYQRPGGTWSAVSLTFDNAVGRTLSISALMDLAANGSENSIGRFYLIHDRPLDVPTVEAGLTGRLSRATLEAILPGSQAFDSHKQFFERFRQLLGIDNPRAFGLLRILQSGRGISGTVNEFFRNHVLDTPKTLDAAEAAVEDFSNLSGIWRQLERARQQRDHLQPVPDTHARYRDAVDSLERNRRLREETLSAYRQRLAVALEERVQNRLTGQAAGMQQDLTAAQERQAGYQGQVSALRSQYAAQGGGRIQSLEREVELARALLAQREAVEDGVRKDLAEAGLDGAAADDDGAGLGVVPPAGPAEDGNPTVWSEAGLEAARERAAAVAKEIALAADAAKELSHDAHGEAADLRRQIKGLEQQIESFRQRTSNIHPDAVRCRDDICASLGLAPEEIPFAGELIEVPAEHAQWRPAAERALRTLATSMLVPGEHIRTVTRFLNRTSLQGLFRCIDVSEPILPQRQSDGDPSSKLAAKLATKDTPMGQWVREKIASHYDYPCVENEDQLAGLAKGISLGGVVKQNSSTLVKDNRHARRSDYVLGFDNKDKIAALGEDLLELERAHRQADELSLERSRHQQQLTDRLAAIRRVTGDTRRWEEVSAAPQRRALDQAQASLERAQEDNEDLAQLQFELETAQLNYDSATASIAVARAELARTDTDLAASAQ
ncbi:MAG TPA: ATP-binding protein, partial [Micrococcaceae bacterium]|nr:ATP-binding protein [Micrococcaceae bacterium]